MIERIKTITQRPFVVYILDLLSHDKRQDQRSRRFVNTLILALSYGCNDPSTTWMMGNGRIMGSPLIPASQSTSRSSLSSVGNYALTEILVHFAEMVINDRHPSAVAVILHPQSALRRNTWSIEGTNWKNFEHRVAGNLSTTLHIWPFCANALTQNFERRLPPSGRPAQLHQSNLPKGPQLVHLVTAVVQLYAPHPQWK
jgi:hypothetical protein